MSIYAPVFKELDALLYFERRIKRALGHNKINSSRPQLCVTSVDIFRGSPTDVHVKDNIRAAIAEHNLAEVIVSTKTGDNFASAFERYFKEPLQIEEG